MLSEHRRTLRAVRAASLRALDLHREILDRERQRLRRERQQLRQVAAHAARAHRRALEDAQTTAWEFRDAWEQAKREGQKLLQLYDRYLGKKGRVA